MTSGVKCWKNEGDEHSCQLDSRVRAWLAAGEPPLCCSRVSLPFNRPMTGCSGLGMHTEGTPWRLMQAEALDEPATLPAYGRG
jgi:hypothetical protein